MLKELVLKGYANKPANKWPTYDGGNLNRQKFITSSEIGLCARKIVYDKTSPPKPFERWGFAERGHSSEAWVVEQLRRSGGNFLYIGDDQVSFYDGYQSGTPDGVWRRAEEDIVLEFKGLDPRTNWNNLPKRAHITQCMQNMDLVRRCHGWDVDRAIILHSDAADYQHMDEDEVKFDLDKAVALRERAEHLMELVQEGSPADAEPEGVYTGDCKFCDHRSKCSGAVQMASREKEKAKETMKVAQNVFK